MVVSAGTVKVFKKTSPNGKLTVYLSRRDFLDHLDQIDPVDGVIAITSPASYLQGRKVYGQLVTIYRYGREQDEVMGVKFSKEMVIASGQIVPSIKEKHATTSIQDKLIAKIEDDSNGEQKAYPFAYQFPPMAPSSVTLQAGREDDPNAKPLGVEYLLRIYVASDERDERGHRRSTVTLAIKKLQYAPSKRDVARLPSALVSKGFTFSGGRINLEVTLDREIYYHGARIGANLNIQNTSRKTVRSVKVSVVQHCEATMVNAQFTRHVASLETREGCPITPGAALTKCVYLIPLAASNRHRRGVALDGFLANDDDVNLASSTLVPPGRCPIDAIGIVVSYSLRVRLDCGTLGGELVADVPFKLLNPAPGTMERQKMDALRKQRSIEGAGRFGKSFDEMNAGGGEDIVFEDFARFRMSREEIE